MIFQNPDVENLACMGAPTEPYSKRIILPRNRKPVPGYM